MSASWWNEKHGQHHMFTNSTGLDEDIKHKYSLSFYPFLFLKWRKDTIVYLLYKLLKFQFIELILIALHYAIIYRQRVIYFVVGVMIAGFYSAIILLGNH